MLLGGMGGSEMLCLYEDGDIKERAQLCTRGRTTVGGRLVEWVCLSRIRR